ncbi:MAG: FAD binding domain-containing protein [Actinomycetota bacterium]
MPLTQIAEYHRPSDPHAAWELLRDGDGTARLLGGGSDLVVRCPAEVTTLIDLSQAGLRYVERDDDGGLRLGAMSTFTDLLERPEVAGHATGVVGEMLVQVGSVLHRNSATIGGHVVRSRLSDVLPVLLALDATVVTYAGERAEHPIGDYLAGDLAPHVVIEVRLPALPERSAAAFTRFSRTEFDHALVNGCCRVDLEDGQVSSARVVVGESGTVGRRVTAAETSLVGAALTEQSVNAAAAATWEGIELHGDWIASAEYRQHLAMVAVTRCLSTVAERLEGGGA